MEELWVVIGMDQIYGGYHGMKEIEIFEGNENEAYELGWELSDNVIGNYSCIYEELDRVVRETCEDENVPYGEGSEIEDEICQEVYSNDIDFYYYKLDKTKLPTLDIDMLERIANEDIDEFIKEYAIK